jgi:hypothetical protein
MLKIEEEKKPVVDYSVLGRYDSNNIFSEKQEDNPF